MELLNGNFPGRLILIPKQQKVSSDSEKDIFAKTWGWDMKGYLVNPPYPPFPPPNNSVIKQVII